MNPLYLKSKIINHKLITLGYSPCPNDTFIFHGLVNGEIKTGNIKFNELLMDIDTLNKRALRGDLDMVKVSFHAYLYLKDRYRLLSSGGALGRGCGPLIVARNKIGIGDLKDKTIAIPGRLTTAFLLLKLFDPYLSNNVIVMPFNKIMDAVAKGRADAGLIIHESRFTYKSHALHCVIDLGDWWESETGLPIPLGCIILKKSAETYLEFERINELLRNSVLYAMNNRAKTMGYVKKNASEIEDDVINSHIDLYVNEYTINYGEIGMRAIDMLLDKASAIRTSLQSLQ